MRMMRRAALLSKKGILVTITGTGNSSRCYIKIGNNKYTTETTLKVPIGTKIYAGIYGYSTDNSNYPGYVIINNKRKKKNISGETQEYYMTVGETDKYWNIILEYSGSNFNVYFRDIPTLEELFTSENMTIHATVGKDSSYQNTGSTVKLAKSNAPTGDCYLFVLRPTRGLFGIGLGISVGIFKMKNKTYSEQIYRSSTLGVAYAGFYEDSSYWWWAQTANASEAGNTPGVTMSLISFSDKYSEYEIDTLLKTVTNGYLAARCETSTGNAQTNDKTHVLLICDKSDLIDFRKGTSNTYELIKGTSSHAASVDGSSSSSKLTVSNVYMGGISYLDETITDDLN